MFLGAVEYGLVDILTGVSRLPFQSTKSHLEIAGTMTATTPFTMPPKVEMGVLFAFFWTVGQI